MNESAEMLPMEGEDLLPEELAEKLAEKREKRTLRLAEIGGVLAKKRDAAAEFRVSSGIEKIWQDAEDAYNGLDDANRDDTAGPLKPAVLDGSFIGVRKKDNQRSTVFLNITRPYTDTASAMTCDMLMPSDDRNWALDPTPVPELEDAKDDQTPVPDLIAVLPDGTQRQGTVADEVAERMKQARKKADAAERRVEDWLVQCQYHSHLRRLIDSAAKLGTGVLKGPFPTSRTRRKAMHKEGAFTLDLVTSIDPTSKEIDPRNLFPDPACGEDIHSGSYIFERDALAARALSELRSEPGYLAEEIEAALIEGPQKKNLNSGAQATSVDLNGKFEIWYFYGYFSREDCETLGVEAGEGIEDVALVATMVNDRVIKAVLNPLDLGEFPYDVLPWQRRPGHWAGVGVPEQGQTPQRMVNAATRNMLDNAGLSGGPILAIDRSKIEPADGKWNLSPRKMFYTKTGAELRSIADAISAIVIPSVQQELLNIVQFALKMMEDVTGLPALMQGQAGPANEPLGAVQLRQNNGSAALRRIARFFDDRITEPHLRRYYAWLMLYGTDEEEKGDYTINARGSSVLVERTLQQQEIMAMGQMVMNPAFELSPAKWAREWLRSRKFDPARFELDDEEKARMEQQQGQQEAPQVTVAKINAESRAQTKQIDAQLAEKKIAADTDRDTVFVRAETERTRAESNKAQAELNARVQLAMLDYANRNKVTLAEIKADLTKEAMRLQTQRELAGVTKLIRKTSQVATPAVEPAGRAPNGMAFQA
jgi:hypothetical protein